MALKSPICDPFFNEFVYSMMYHCPHSIRKNFPDKYRKVLQTDLRARRFATDAPISDKMELLYYIGVHFHLMFYPVANTTTNEIYKILREYATKKKSHVLEDSAKMGVFFLSDKNIAFSNSVISDLMHGNQYKVNLQYIKALWTADQWEKEVSVITNDNLYLAAESIGAASKLALRILRNAELSEKFELTKYDLFVLLFLYSTPNKYVKEETILGEFTEEMSKGLVRRTCGRLLKKYYIRPSADKVKSYSISAAGINKANEFLKTAVKID